MSAGRLRDTEAAASGIQAEIEKGAVHIAQSLETHETIKGVYRHGALFSTLGTEHETQEKFICQPFSNQPSSMA
jgi:hypothetical protein